MKKNNISKTKKETKPPLDEELSKTQKEKSIEEEEEETELEDLVEETTQSMSTTFTPAVSRTPKPISPTLKQNEIQEPIQDLETELAEVPETTTNQDEEEQGYEVNKPYSETPTEESAQQLSDYQTTSPEETQSYDTAQQMNPIQKFDTSSGLTSGMQNEKKQFQQWQQSQGDPFSGRPKPPQETYTVQPQKIDETKNLPFKKNKKRGPFGF